MKTNAGYYCPECVTRQTKCWVRDGFVKDISDQSVINPDHTPVQQMNNVNMIVGFKLLD